MLSATGFAQNFTVSLANPVNPSPTTFEVDVMLTINAPAEGVLLSQISTGINYNVGILNGGTPCTTAGCGSWAYVAGTKAAALNFLTPTTNTTRGPSPYGHLRIVGTTLTNANSQFVPVGTYRLGTYRLTNTVPFTTGSNANLWLQPNNLGGSSNTIVSWFVVGTTTGLLAYTTTSPTASPGVSLTHTSAATFSLPLNAANPCFTSGTFTQTPACSINNNNGTATITMAAVPTSLLASYILDGGASTPVTLSATGTFTLTGLAAGPHTLTVTGDGACTTPVSVPFTINATPSVTPTFTQVGPFCSGATIAPLPTTSLNGVTGTWAPAIDNANSGTYTFTPAAGQCATTATMTITVNPTINTTTTITACNSYTWAENGVTYTASGMYTVAATLQSGIFNTLATWNATAAANNATVYTNPLTGYPTAPPATVPVGPVNVTFSAPSGLYSSGTFISTNTANQALTMTFNPPVYGVSGNYYVTNIADAAIAGTITITYSDGTIDTQPVTADTDFFGYYKNTTISSVVITPVATSPAVARWSTVKNLKVAVAAPCQTKTLDLTINPNINTTTTVSACDTYTWTENGTTYTTSGVYTIPTAPQSGIFNNQANWLSTATANGATVSLNPLSGYPNPPPATVPVGPVNVTFSAPTGLYSNGTFISANTANQALTMTFSTPVYGVSGNYYVTNFSDAAIAGTITITYSDGTTDTQTVTADTDFFGYFKNTSITSVVITPVATSPVVSRWSTVKNLRVATSPSSCLTKTLNLTITPSTTNGSVTTSICSGGSYTWPLPNGTGLSYTTAQTNLTNVVGCNTATLNLTITPSVTPTFTQVAPICAGATIAALPTTSNNGIAGTWAPAIDNTTTTTYTFTPTSANCTTTATMTIVVNALPAATFGANPFPVCAGTSTTLTASVTNFTPTVNFVDGSSVSQSFNMNAAAFGTPIASPLSAMLVNSTTDGCTAYAPGTFTGKIVLIQRGTCAFAIKAQNAQNAGAIGVLLYNNVAGALIPAGTAAGVTIPVYGITQANGLALIAAMTGGQLSVTLAPAPPLSYLWSTGGTTNSISTGILNANTDFSVTITNTATGCSNLLTVTVPVTANTVPLFTQVAPICSGGALAALPTTSNNGVAGTWAPAVDNTTTTTYTFTPTPVAGQCLSTATMTIVVNSAPTPTGSSTQSFSVANANDATIANIVVSPAGVTWYGSLSNAQTGTNPLPTTTVLTNNATYWAVNVVGACSSTPFAVTVTVTLGNDEFNSLNFTFYPNPTSSVLNISYSRTISDIQVINLLGQEVMTRKTNDSEVQIDLSPLADATYFVKVTSEGKSKIIKVIKSN